MRIITNIKSVGNSKTYSSDFLLVNYVAVINILLRITKYSYHIYTSRFLYMKIKVIFKIFKILRIL